MHGWLDTWMLLFSGVDVVVVLKKRRMSPNLLSSFRLLLSQLVGGSLQLRSFC